MIVIEYSYLSTPPKRVEIEESTILVGRHSGEETVDLDLTPDITVSRRHARITRRGNYFWVEDLGSRGGTWVNDHQIFTKTQVTLHDRLRIGQTELIVKSKAQLTTVPGEDTVSSIEQAPSDPVELPEEDGLFQQGSFTSSISAVRSPAHLLLPEEEELASLEIVERRLAAFYDLGVALGSKSSVGRLLKTVVTHLLKAIPGAQRGALLLKDGRRLILKAYLPERAKPSVSLNLAGLAIEKQEAFTWRYDAPGEMGKLTDSIVWHGTKCAMYAPLIWQDEVIGIAYVDNYITNEAFNKDDLLLLMAMSTQAAIFVKNHALQEDLRHQEVVRSNLLRQFSPQVVDHLEDLLQESGHLGLGGERVEPVTILNSDVRGFTALSAQMEPGDVMEMLNQLFSVCIPIIFKYNGTVDKYIGDAILAVFGSPDPDLEGKQWGNAVRAAIEMQRAIKKLGREWQRNGRPVFKVGIGIHTGAVLQGFIGSDEQMEYTVIGDTVNRTSRYCNGANGGDIIISPAVYKHVMGMVEAIPKTVQSKHPGTEADLDAFLVKGFGTQSLGLSFAET